MGREKYCGEAGKVWLETISLHGTRHHFWL
jgi:hypothetical protein